MSPRGKILTQDKAKEIAANFTDLIVICGHYEGVDQRALDLTDAEEISIGDFVLTGGELPCAILLDAVARLVPGVLADPVCHEEESVASGLLEEDRYTKPHTVCDLSVPEELISGDHAAVKRWKREMSLKITAERRPDMLLKYKSKLTVSDIKYLENVGYKELLR
ncbi:hypothetical protein FACS1894105_12440 [Clostridia bacterium]|nr:hypothetical protein FACS1894105_12440 [Clostridia bacterium]